MKGRSRLLLAAGFILVAFVCARLGAWQVGRLEERRAANAVSARTRAAAPVLLNQTERGDTLLLGRRVRARGRYDHAYDVIIRGRVYGGVPGVEIISPLVLDGSRMAVLVNRGFVPTPDALRIDPRPLHEPGEKEVAGIAVPARSGGGAPLARDGITTWSRVDLGALRSSLPYQLYPILLLQTPDSSLPKFPRRLEPPPIDDGPHLSYAIQWFSFATIALVFAGVMVREERKHGGSRANIEGRGSLQLVE